MAIFIDLNESLKQAAADYFKAQKIECAQPAAWAE